MNIDISKTTFLHGRLECYIDRAEKLPDTDIVGKTDPFVSCQLDEVWLFKTFYINNDLNPVWEQKFSIPVCHEAKEIVINVRDKEMIGKEHVASLSIPCDEVVEGKKCNGWEISTLDR